MASGTSIVNWARSKLGISYVWGGESDRGYDCSGLTQKAYSSQGITIPRTAQEQYNAATKVSLENLQKGDLIFFATGSGENYVSHVGIYSGNGKFIHAPHTGDLVKESELNDYWKSKMVSGGRFDGVTVPINSTSESSGGFASVLIKSIGGNIIQVISVVLIVVLCGIFFMKAFDIQLV